LQEAGDKKLKTERIRLTCHLSIFDKTGITESFSSQLSVLKKSFILMAEKGSHY